MTMPSSLCVVHLEATPPGGPKHTRLLQPSGWSQFLAYTQIMPGSL